MPREEQARREMLEEREQVVVVVEVVGLVGRGVVEVGFEEGGELVGVGGGGEGYAMREVILNFGRHQFGCQVEYRCFQVEHCLV